MTGRVSQGCSSLSAARGSRRRGRSASRIRRQFPKTSLSLFGKDIVSQPTSIFCSPPRKDSSFVAYVSTLCSVKPKQYKSDTCADFHSHIYKTELATISNPAFNTQGDTFFRKAVPLPKSSAALHCSEYKLATGSPASRLHRQFKMTPTNADMRETIAYHERLGDERSHRQATGSFLPSRLPRPPIPEIDLTVACHGTFGDKGSHQLSTSTRLSSRLSSRLPQQPPIPVVDPDLLRKINASRLRVMQRMKRQTLWSRLCLVPTLALESFLDLAMTLTRPATLKQCIKFLLYAMPVIAAAMGGWQAFQGMLVRRHRHLLYKRMALTLRLSSQV